MVQYIVAYLAAALTFVVVDFIWLSNMGGFYREILGSGVLADTVNIGAAICFYLLYTAGIVYFGVVPALASGRMRTATLNGAIFGFLAYATYDLTNHATIRNWTLSITVADMIWGAVLTAIAASAGYLVAAWLNRLTASHD